jgi:hypothetical protein
MINWIKNLFKKKEEQFTPVFPPNSWSVSRTTGRIVFKIPVGNLSKEEAEKQLKQLISSYQKFPNGYDKIEKIERILNRLQPKEEN